MLAITGVELCCAEGDTVLVKPPNIARIGYESSLWDEIAGVKRVSIDGGYVVPGLHDSHTHLAFSQALSADLRYVRNVDELVTTLRRHLEKVKRLGYQYVVGRGWDHEIFPGRAMPTLGDMDMVSKEYPVIAVRVCGHLAVVNSAMLKKIHEWGLDRKYPNYIIKDGDTPTGIIVEELLWEVIGRLPPPPRDLLIKYTIRYLREYASYGVTHLNIVSVEDRHTSVLEEALSKVPLVVGLYPHLRAYSSVKKRVKRASVCGIKMFADGSLGAETAYLKEPFLSGRNGRMLISVDDLADALRALGNDSGQLAIHAIGDAAIHEVIKLARSMGIDPDRVRIEHASLTPPDVLEAIAAYRPHIVAQPHFMISDWWADKKLGKERARYLYALRSINSITKLYGSSDYPVEPKNPMLGIYSAVLRPGIGSLNPGEALSVDEAFTIYSRDPCMGETLLSEGARADIAVLNSNPRKMSPHDIPSIRSLVTLVGGVPVYVDKGLVSGFDTF